MLSRALEQSGMNFAAGSGNRRWMLSRSKTQKPIVPSAVSWPRKGSCLQSHLEKQKQEVSSAEEGSPMLPAVTWLICWHFDMLSLYIRQSGSHTLSCCLSNSFLKLAAILANRKAPPLKIWGFCLGVAHKKRDCLFLLHVICTASLYSVK